MNKTTSIIIAILILGGAFYYTNSDSATSLPLKGSTQKVSNVPVENSVIKDGVQYITITAQAGYSPRMSLAKSGIPTKLIVKTNGTYDCSSSLVIRSLNYRNTLPNTGETTIDAGTPKKGDTIQGVCGMGMYNFLVTFS
jgi:plastocyanin domain-containing protein